MYDVASLDTTKLEYMKKGFGWIYINNAGWADGLSTYFEALMANMVEIPNNDYTLGVPQ